METRSLEIENELRYINNKLAHDGLELTEWVRWFDKKVKLIEELMEIQNGMEA